MLDGVSSAPQNNSINYPLAMLRAQCNKLVDKLPLSDSNKGFHPWKKVKSEFGQNEVKSEFGQYVTSTSASVLQSPQVASSIGSSNSPLGSSSSTDSPSAISPTDNTPSSLSNNSFHASGSFYTPHQHQLAQPVLQLSPPHSNSSSQHSNNGCSLVNNEYDSHLQPQSNTSVSSAQLYSMPPMRLSYDWTSGYASTGVAAAAAAAVGFSVHQPMTSAHHMSAAGQQWWDTSGLHHGFQPTTTSNSVYNGGLSYENGSTHMHNSMDQSSSSFTGVSACPSYHSGSQLSLQQSVHHRLPQNQTAHQSNTQIHLGPQPPQATFAGINSHHSNTSLLNSTPNLSSNPSNLSSLAPPPCSSSSSFSSTVSTSSNIDSKPNAFSSFSTSIGYPAATIPSIASPIIAAITANSRSDRSSGLNRKYSGRGNCDCPNCQEADRTGGLNGKRNSQHNCHFAGCGKVYHKTSHLKAHLRWHSGERPFVCTYDGCHKKFTRSDELQRHVRTHTGDKKFGCKHCPKRFTRSDHLNKHLKTHLSGKKDKLDDLVQHNDENDTMSVMGGDSRLDICMDIKKQQSEDRSLINNFSSSQAQLSSMSSASTAQSSHLVGNNLHAPSSIGLSTMYGSTNSSGLLNSTSSLHSSSLPFNLQYFPKEW